MQPHSREEVLNVYLALLLTKRGIVAAPEQILSRVLESGRAMPDVLVDYQGLRTVIEGKVHTGKAAERAVIKDIKNRVEQGIAHLGIAVLYPLSLRTAKPDTIETELTSAVLRIAVVSEAEEALQLQLPLEGLAGRAPQARDEVSWEQGDLDHLADMLRRSYDKLVKENVVTVAVNALKIGMEPFARILANSPGALERAADALGVRGEVVAEDEDNI